MSAELTAPPTSSETLPRPKGSPQVCQFAGVYFELLGMAPKDSQNHGCSLEPPEPRDYPAPRGGGGRYVLCNGHLRDIYSSMEELRDSRGSPLTEE
jgi:hypothetical protein